MIKPEDAKMAAFGMRKATESMSNQELVHFAESTLQVATFAQTLLRERSILLWKEMNTRIEKGELLALQ